MYIYTLFFYGERLSTHRYASRRHDHCPDESSGDAPARGPDVLALLLLGEVRHVKGLRKAAP